MYYSTRNVLRAGRLRRAVSWPCWSRQSRVGDDATLSVIFTIADASETPTGAPGALVERGVMNRSRIKRAIRVVAKGVFAAADLFSARRPGPRILIYHQIGAGLGRQMEVTEASFGQQIDWMRDHGRIVDLKTAIDGRGEPDAAETFVLTFDDGYEDVYHRAWPLLRDGELPFVLYLTTGPVESRHPLTPGGYADPLTWAQINEMLDSGLMTLGAHTHEHRDLRSLSTMQIESEVQQSNDLILLRTAVDARHFAYPWGYWSEDADQVIRDAYTTATLGSGPPITAETDAFLLNRVPVQLSDCMAFFRRKMTTGMRLEDRTRRILTNYNGP